MNDNSSIEEKQQAEQIWAIAMSEEKQAQWFKEEKKVLRKDWSYWSWLYAVAALVICLVFTIPITIIPQHNVIEFPEYWYEVLIPTTLCILLYWSVLAIMRFKVFFEELASLATFKTWISIFLAFAIPYNLAYATAYVIWTHGLGFNHPLPFVGYISLFPMFPVVFTTVWYQFPRDFRLDPTTRKRLKNYLLYMSVFYFACMERNILNVIMVVLPTDWQPVMAIVLPATREFELWILDKLVDRATKEENRDAKLITSIEANSNYSAFLAIALGSLATDATLYCILAVEFCLNMYNVIKIIRINKKINANESERDKLDPIKEGMAQDMVVVGIVMILMTIAYVISLLMAYYGPNGSILGNIRNEYWSFKGIHNIEKLLAGIFKMFAIDLIGLITGGILLWKFSSIDFVKEACKAMKKYFPFISLTIAGAVTRVSFKTGHRHIQ